VHQGDLARPGTCCARHFSTSQLTTSGDQSMSARLLSFETGRPWEHNTNTREISHVRGGGVVLVQQSRLGQALVAKGELPVLYRSCRSCSEGKLTG